MSLNIPQGWALSNLGSIATYINGRAFKPTEWETTGLPIIRIQNLNNSNAPYNHTNGEFEEKYKVRKDDLLFAWSASLGTYVWKHDDAWLNQHIFKVIPHKGIDKTFLYYLLTHVTNELYAKAHGSGMVHVTKAVFDANPVLIPPIKQQAQIIQKIEELFSEIDDGVESLEIAKKQLDVYRKAILIQAFNGNLTKQWRTLNSDKLPTEEYFLSAINRDREERYEKQVADWNKDLSHWEKAGKIGSKPKKPKPLPRIEATQISTEGLPKGWIKTNLEYVCDFITKGTTPAKNELFAKQGDIPFIKVYNLTHKGYLDFSIDPTFVTKQTHEGFLKRSKVYPNDVLMNIVGPPLGKVSIVPDSYPEWNINQAIAIYRSNLIDSKYLSEFLLNENTVRAMMSQSKATAGQFNLTLEICRNFPIPVCSKLEQAEIVKSLSENLSNAQYLQETIDQQLEQLMLLKQTVLQKAFSGELVPQDPNDEPASVLLERIKAEKEEEMAKAKANKAPKKPTKRKTKATKEDEPAQQELI